MDASGPKTEINRSWRSARRDSFSDFRLFAFGKDYRVRAFRITLDIRITAASEAVAALPGHGAAKSAAGKADLQLIDKCRAAQCPATIPGRDPSRIEHVNRVPGARKADVKKAAIGGDLLRCRSVPGQRSLVQAQHDHNIILAALGRVQSEQVEVIGRSILSSKFARI
jgi:hypothetical protein